jgi:phosphohistidine phosphatase
MAERKTLFLVRHGKAAESWDYDTDFERPLTHKGKLAVAALGEALRNEDLIPEMILASPAFRTAQTARTLSEVLGLDPNEICYEAGLYPGNLSQYRDAILKYGSGVKRLMLVGHNPNLEELIAHLSGYSILCLPTSGCVVFEWSEKLLHNYCQLRFHHVK